MEVRLWRRSPSRSDSSTASSTADSSAIAGVSSPPWIKRTDRSAANFSLLAKIAAWSVVFGIVLEDWDIFGMAWQHPYPYLIRASVGGVIVALGIAMEIRFSSLEAKAERKIRDWYSLRVAELNAETERLRKENNETALLLAYRSVGDMQAFEDAMRPFSGTKYAMEVFVAPAFTNPTMEPEIANFQWLLNMGLQRAGWILVNGYVSRRGNIGFGVWLLNIPDHPIYWATGQGSACRMA
jgi:hypothetical protein